jgi:hypothetical protein
MTASTPDTTPKRLFVVRCSESEKPLSKPMDEFNASLLRDFHDDNQGEDYCVGDHYIEEVTAHDQF